MPTRAQLLIPASPFDGQAIIRVVNAGQLTAINVSLFFRSSGTREPGQQEVPCYDLTFFLDAMSCFYLSISFSSEMIVVCLTVILRPRCGYWL